MGNAGSSDNPFVFGELLRDDVPENNRGYGNVVGKTVRSPTLNTSQKNLILIVAGDSNTSGTGPSLFTPVNASVVDNFNVYDGATYNYDDPPVGCALGGVGIGGNICGRIADAIVTSGAFARVIVVPLGIGGSNVGHWVQGGMLYNKIPAAMKRLEARGITPSVENVTFALIYMTGANDHGTSSSAYVTGYQQVVNKAKSVGFVGRVFVPVYSMLNNVTDANVRAGQVSLVDNVQYFSAGDLDALPSTPNRQVDGTHFSATGQANVAATIAAAIHASGSPF